MANEEHFAKLREGVESWNQWKAENAEITPDLSEAELPLGFGLQKVDLVGVQLQKADLRDARLQEAYLHKGTAFRCHFSRGTATGS